MRILLVATTLALLTAVASGQTPIDKHTTFMASFDDSAMPDYCAGDWRAALRGEAELTQGKFSKALALKARQAIAYDADQKICLPAFILSGL